MASFGGRHGLLYISCFAIKSSCLYSDLCHSLQLCSLFSLRGRVKLPRACSSKVPYVVVLRERTRRLGQAIWSMQLSLDSAESFLIDRIWLIVCNWSIDRWRSEACQWSESGMYQSRAKTIWNYWISDEATDWRTDMADAAVNAGVSLTKTTKAQICLQRIFFIWETEVFATIRETYPRFRMWHSEISKPRVGLSQAIAADNLSGWSNGSSETERLRGVGLMRSGAIDPLLLSYWSNWTFGE